MWTNLLKIVSNLLPWGRMWKSIRWNEFPGLFVLGLLWYYGANALLLMALSYYFGHWVADTRRLKNNSEPPV